MTSTIKSTSLMRLAKLPFSWLCSMHMWEQLASYPICEAFLDWLAKVRSLITIKNQSSLWCCVGVSALGKTYDASISKFLYVFLKLWSNFCKKCDGLKGSAWHRMPSQVGYCSQRRHDIDSLTQAMQPDAAKSGTICP